MKIPWILTGPKPIKMQFAMKASDSVRLCWRWIVDEASFGKLDIMKNKQKLDQKYPRRNGHKGSIFCIFVWPPGFSKSLPSSGLKSQPRCTILTNKKKKRNIDKMRGSREYCKRIKTRKEMLIICGEVGHTVNV
jgi:hypothetical protein